MSIKVTLDIEGQEELQEILKQLPPSVRKKALRDAWQLVENSLKAGYQRRISPNGEKWADNPEWIQLMKGNDTPLTGPLTSKIQGGPFANGYKYKQVNSKRMKNSLIHSVDENKAVIEFDSDAKERAEINQSGGKSKMILTSLVSGKDVEFDINVQARPHFGLATDFARIPGGNDVDLILGIFSDYLDQWLNGDIK